MMLSGVPICEKESPSDILFHIGILLYGKKHCLLIFRHYLRSSTLFKCSALQSVFAKDTPAPSSLHPVLPFVPVSLRAGAKAAYIESAGVLVKVQIWVSSLELRTSDDSTQVSAY